jgi:hypothetical protein
MADNLFNGSDSIEGKGLKMRRALVIKRGARPNGTHGFTSLMIWQVPFPGKIIGGYDGEGNLAALISVTAGL